MFEGLRMFAHELMGFMNFSTIFSVLWATQLGIIVGMLPGLTATMGVALMTTLTFKMDAGNVFLKNYFWNSTKMVVPAVLISTIFGALNFNNIIVHCGSGVTACHTLLAISYAGLEMPKLYVGSWSEWSRNNKPIVNIRLNLKQ